MDPDPSKRDGAADRETAADGEDPAEPDGISDQRTSTRPALELQIQNPCGYPDVSARELRPWLANLLSELSPDADSATVRFVSDREMRSLNRAYRSKDATTDVLSFPGDLPARDEARRSWTQPPPEDADAPRLPDGLPRHLGDVVVSVPTARRQAAERGHGIARELRLLTLHGVLHCLGYDHEIDDGTMGRLEARLRSRLLPTSAVTLEAGVVA